MITHERIFTTLAKARELQSHMEKLIHKAKRLTREDHLYLRQNLTTVVSINKLKSEIAPRFRKLPAGYTRVENAGTRANDCAKVGMIEIMGNELMEMQRNRVEVEKETYNLETFWQWEAKVCEQEVDYYEGLLRDLKREVDAETLETLAAENLEDFDAAAKTKKLTTD